MVGRRWNWHISILCLAVCCYSTGSAVCDDLDQEGIEFFEKRVRPILVDHCYKCHSEKAEQVEGDLYVDSREGLLKGGDQGPAIEPGNPDGSLLFEAVRYETEDLKMPPDKRLEDQQIADIRKWIEMGAPDPRKAKQQPPDRSRINIDEARTEWPYRAPTLPDIPAVKHANWPDGNIDLFILQKLEERGLEPAGDAEKRVLLRRLTFDLTGLPPSPDELDAFLADERPDAVSRVVDRLLATPQYGERWARHWMDVVRYADTAGDNSDYPVPQMYKYRNWIIRAWNEDLPYDEFTIQQLAGDLCDHQAPEDRINQAIATGYIANARRFGSRVSDYPQHLTIEDTIDNLGRTFLGLTINCTRCHDHKFDPLTSEDYYGLYGFFHSTRYPWPGIELEKRQRDFVPLVSEQVVLAEKKKWNEREEQFHKSIREADANRKRADEALKKAAGELESAKKAGDQNTIARLESEQNKVKEHADAAAKTAKAKRQELEAFKQAPLPYETAYAVADATKREDVCVQIKGDPARQGPKVRRRFPLVLGGFELPADDTTSGRLTLARWIASDKNPLTARVIANRLWHYHFGRGIVATPSDFGRQGRAPTHPELLDYLAVRLSARHWSLKQLHRDMVLSHIYRTASQVSESVGPVDPNLVDAENNYLWRFRTRRLDAESIRDAMLVVSDSLDWSMGGEHPFPEQSKWDFTQHKPFRAVYETNRRSVYLMTQRIQRHPYLAIFDGADTGASTAARVTSTTTLQALYLLNDEFVHQRADSFARRLLEGHDRDDDRIRMAFRLALCRNPTDSELKAAKDFLKQVIEAAKSVGAAEPDRPRMAWSSLTRALLRLDEFVYLD